MTLPMLPSTSCPGPIAAPAVSTPLGCTIITDLHELVWLGPAWSDLLSRARINGVMRRHLPVS